jgi:hypothetical protein
MMDRPKGPKLKISKQSGVWWTTVGKTVVAAHLTGEGAFANIDNSKAVAKHAISQAIRSEIEKRRAAVDYAAPETT